MLGMAGVRESWKDPRVKAALLLSPYILPYFHHGDLGRVKVPVMVQGGTLDLGVTPFLKRFYDGLTSQKYYLVLKGLDHYGWTDFNSIGRTTTEALRKGNPKLIAEYSLAFFDQHLRGIDRKKALAHREEEIHSWRATPGAE
jgi:predicted dienelactone hydrolase